MTDSYKDYPRSITELKGEKDHDSRTWTPRDALINTLRDLDSGELEADHIMILYGRKSQNSGFSQGGSFTYYEQVGMLEITKNYLIGI